MKIHVLYLINHITVSCYLFKHYFFSCDLDTFKIVTKLSVFSCRQVTLLLSIKMLVILINFLAFVYFLSTIFHRKKIHCFPQRSQIRIMWPKETKRQLNQIHKHFLNMFKSFTNAMYASHVT